MSILRRHSDGAIEAPPRHTVPVIDRMMDIVAVLEEREAGATISGLMARLALPRTTIYRILNTLRSHGMVQRDAAGAYRLGPRVLAMAAHVAARRADIDIAAAAQPVMDRVSGELGTSVKLSTLDADGVLVVAVAQGRRAYALTVERGQRLQPHVSAAGKLLLAHLPAEALAAWLARPMKPATRLSISDPGRLKAELGRIRRQGWAYDRGESAPSILAYAAPVSDRDGRVQAAISLPFLSGADPRRMRELRAATVAAAREISAALAAA